MCEYPVMATDIERVARKPHRCIECREVIEKGELYHFHKSLADHHWFSSKTCLRCFELWSKVSEHYHSDDCLEQGGLKEAYLELREPLTFGGLVPLKWLARAHESNRYRHKYYGERLFA